MRDSDSKQRSRRLCANSGVLGRRAFTKSLIGGAAALAVGGLKKPRQARAQTAPAVGASKALEKELVFSARGGSLGEVWRTRVIPEFERKFDCKVTYLINDSVPAFAKVVAERASPQTDVLWSTDLTHVQGNALGVFDELDRERIPNFERCYGFAKYPDGVGVIWCVGGCAIGYNHEVYSQNNIVAPTSWSDIFVPATKGHVAWLDLSTLQGITAFLMLNKLHGGTEDNVDPVFKFLRENKANILAVVSSPAQVDNLFQQREAWVTANVDARISVLKRTGFPIELVYAAEGIPQVGVALELIKNAPHPNLAHEFINFVLSDEVQTIVGQEMGLGPVNKHANLSEEKAENLIYGPERIAKLVQFNYDVVVQDFAKWLDRWNRELSS